MPGEPWKLCDKWGHRVSSRQSVGHCSKSSGFGRSSVVRAQDQFSPGLTKDPSLLMAAKAEEKLNEVDAAS